MNLTRTLILGCCIATAPFTAPLQAGIIQSVKEAIWGCQAPPPTIKVLIADNLQDIPVEVRGGYRLYDPHTQDYLSSRYFSKKQQFKAVNSGLKWGEEFPGIYQLQLIPDEDTVLLVNGRPYRGTLYIYAIEDTVSIVNEVPIEDYLESVLSSSNQQQSPETLAAIAITERTAAYYAVENPKSAYWAVQAEAVGYKGSGRAHLPTPVEKAIAATRYMLMSRTTAYEKVTTPFAAQWSTGDQKKTSNKMAVLSLLTISEVETQAKNGANAAQILAKAFPGVAITISYP